MLAKLAGYAGSAILDNLPDVVNKVGSLLAHKVKIVLEVENETDDLNLTLIDGYHSSGRYETSPDGTVYPHTASVFSSESRDGSFMTGAIGSVVYSIGNGDYLLGIYYSNPSIGGFKANALVFPTSVGGFFHIKPGPGIAEEIYDWLSSSGGDYPYTESSGSRTAHGFTVSYSAGEQSTYSLSKTTS